MELSSSIELVNQPNLPGGWIQVELGKLITHCFSGATPRRSSSHYFKGTIPWINSGELNYNVITDTAEKITKEAVQKTNLKILPIGTFLMAITGLEAEGTRGSCAITGLPATTNQSCMAIFPTEQLLTSYLFHYYVYQGKKLALQYCQGTKQQSYTAKLVKQLPITIPLNKQEQFLIASTLDDINLLLTCLDQLIVKKRNIKLATMQNLLTGKMVLPGFSGKCEAKPLSHIADCLDNLRVPLNESQRQKMQGVYPYCGANGVLDYVDSYVIDDDIILVAEDGGYFDEYETRPIAYRMIGKCWVNNHAHILKAKHGVDQGFLFYSLVHKNILPFLASATRAKLNKSEMNKIQINLPIDEQEQSAIAKILSDMDNEIFKLEVRRDKTKELKQAMMQQLLTGKIRLINEERSDA